MVYLLSVLWALLKENMWGTKPYTYIVCDSIILFEKD